MFSRFLGIFRKLIEIKIIKKLFFEIRKQINKEKSNK